MKQHYFLSLFLSLFTAISAQPQKHPIPDSLKSKSYSYLDDRIYELRKDSAHAAEYLAAYLNKAKNEQNWKEIIYAYQNILHQSPESLRIVYADSMVYAAGKSGDDALLGSAYLSKGIAYYGQKKYEEAYNNYITANHYISKTDDSYLTFKVKHQIAQIKYYLGFYEEAISLFRECLTYFKNENARAYLNTIHSLGVCYNRIGNYGECTEMNTLGIAEGKRLKDSDMEAYFIHSEGINEYFKSNFRKAVSNIESSLPAIRENKDFGNESVGNFYIGKSLWALKEKDKALPYLIKVDRTFIEKNYLRPDQREVYELLIDYYKGKSDLKSQLYYIDQLLKADRMLIETHKYLAGKIHKEYDTRELILEKEKIKDQLVREKYYDIIGIAIIAALFLLSIFLTARHYKNRKFYQKKFEELMKKTPPEQLQSFSQIKGAKTKMLDIPQETVESVLKELEKFISDKKFLEKDLRLSAVASSLGTNSKYFSKILSTYKNKRFIEYFNDLKIDYIIQKLKENKMMRLYSNAALAEEAGFSSTQPFVFAFKARTGMPVHFFIEQINKAQE